MTLEQQVCSLESAKRLKELGVKQESYFIYDAVWGANEVESWEIRHGSLSTEPEEVYSAFTVAELGEMFIGQIVNFEHRKDGKYRVWWYGSPKTMVEQQIHNIDADTEAEARAKMLIYLLENNLITKA